MNQLLSLSRYAARLVNGSWCYCKMGYDAFGVYGVEQVIETGFATQQAVYNHADTIGLHPRV